MMGESPLRRTQHQQQLNQAQQQHPHHHHHHQESTHLQPTNLRIIDKRSLVKDNGRVSYLLAFTSTNIKNSQQQQQQQQFTCWVDSSLAKMPVHPLLSTQHLSQSQLLDLIEDYETLASMPDLHSLLLDRMHRVETTTNSTADKHHQQQLGNNTDIMSLYSSTVMIKDHEAAHNNYDHNNEEEEDDDDYNEDEDHDFKLDDENDLDDDTSSISSSSSKSSTLSNDNNNNEYKSSSSSSLLLNVNYAAARQREQDWTDAHSLRLISSKPLLAPPLPLVRNRSLSNLSNLSVASINTVDSSSSVTTRAASAGGGSKMGVEGLLRSISKNNPSSSTSSSSFSLPTTGNSSSNSSEEEEGREIIVPDNAMNVDKPSTVASLSSTPGAAPSLPPPGQNDGETGGQQQKISSSSSPPSPSPFPRTVPPAISAKNFAHVLQSGTTTSRSKYGGIMSIDLYDDVYSQLELASNTTSTDLAVDNKDEDEVLSHPDMDSYISDGEMNHHGYSKSSTSTTTSASKKNELLLDVHMTRIPHGKILDALYAPIHKQAQRKRRINESASVGKAVNMVVDDDEDQNDDKAEEFDAFTDASLTLLFDRIREQKQAEKQASATSGKGKTSTVDNNQSQPPHPLLDSSSSSTATAPYLKLSASNDSSFTFISKRRKLNNESVAAAAAAAAAKDLDDDDYDYENNPFRLIQQRQKERMAEVEARTHWRRCAECHNDLSNSPSTSTADTPTTTKSLSVLKCMSCSLAGHSHCQSKTRLAHLAKRASLYLAFRCAMCTGHNFPPCCKLCHQKEPSNDTFIYASFLNDDDVNDNSGSNNGGGGSGNNIASSMNAAAHMDSMGILFRCERCRCAMHMTCLVSKFQRDYPNDDLRALKLANSISSIGGSGGGAGTSGGDASLSSRSIIASSSTSCSSSSPFNYFTQSWRCVDCITWDLPVEKVLTWRDPVLSDISNSSKSSSPPLLEREYLVNFSSLSYLHNEWVPESWLKHSKDAAPKLRDYILLVEEEERAAKFAGLVTKTTSRTLLVPKTQAEVEDIAFTTVEKVLDVRFAKEFVGISNAATAVAVVTGSGGMLAAATVGGTTKSSMGLVKTSTSSSSTASSSLQQQWKNQQGLSGAAVTSSFDNICEVLIKWAGLPYENATWEIYPSKKDDALRTSYDAVTAERLRREIKAAMQKYHVVQELALKSAGSKMSSTMTLSSTSSSSVLDSSAVVFSPVHQQPPFIKGGALKDYQIKGINRLLYQRSKNISNVVADEIGLGKTVQLASFLSIVCNSHCQWPFLIVAPESRTETWARVFATWCPDLIVTHLCGSTKSRELIRETLIVGRNGAIRTHVTVVSYQDMATDAAFLKSVKWSSLILDLRRSNTGVASGSGEGDFGWRFETVDSIGADHRIVTIDTPFIGNLEKLQNLMRFVDPEKFPNDSTSWDQLEGGHCDEIMSSIFDEIKPYFLKRVKKDVSDHLESKVEVLVPVELTKMQKRVYRAKLMVRRPALAVSRSDNNNNIHLDIISDLLQVCGYPEPVGELGLDGVNGDEVYKTMFVSESAKIRCVRYMLAHLKCKGHKVVIFSSYSNTLDAVEKLLQIEQHVYCRLDAHISLKDKAAAIDLFNAPNSSKYVILLPSHDTLGCPRLTAADTVIMMDARWDSVEELQTTSMYYHVGQPKSVVVYRLYAQNTLEDKIIQIAKNDNIDMDGYLQRKEGDELLAEANISAILRYGARNMFTTAATNYATHPRSQSTGSGRAVGISSDTSADEFDQLTNRSELLQMRSGLTGSSNPVAGAKVWVKGKLVDQAPQLFPHSSGMGSVVTDQDVEDSVFWTDVLAQPNYEALLREDTPAPTAVVSGGAGIPISNGESQRSATTATNNGSGFLPSTFTRGQFYNEFTSISNLIFRKPPLETPLPKTTVAASAIPPVMEGSYSSSGDGGGVLPLSSSSASTSALSTMDLSLKSRFLSSLLAKAKGGHARGGVGAGGAGGGDLSVSSTPTMRESLICWQCYVPKQPSHTVANCPIRRAAGGGRGGGADGLSSSLPVIQGIKILTNQERQQRQLEQQQYQMMVNAAKSEFMSSVNHQQQQYQYQSPEQQQQHKQQQQQLGLKSTSIFSPVLGSIIQNIGNGVGSSDNFSNIRLSHGSRSSSSSSSTAAGGGFSFDHQPQRQQPYPNQPPHTTTTATTAKACNYCGASPFHLFRQCPLLRTDPARMLARVDQLQAAAGGAGGGGGGIDAQQAAEVRQTATFYLMNQMRLVNRCL